MDRLQVLHTASTVLRAGSFSGAARQLGLSPAAVAKQVAQLESKLALRLFHRNTHHLSATDEGRALLESLAAPLQEIESAWQAGRAALAPRSAVSGTVKVSCTGGFARLALLPELPTLQARHPGLHVDLRLETRRVDLTAEGYDCAIGTALAADSSFVARPLVMLRAVVVASPAYLQRHGRPAAPEDLAACRAIVQRSETTGRLRDWTLSPVAGGRGATSLQPKPALALTDPETVAAAAIAGCGVALVGLHHAGPALADGRLVRLLPEWVGPRVPVVIYYAKRRLLPERTRAFVEHVLATVPANPAFVLPT